MGPGGQRPWEGEPAGRWERRWGAGGRTALQARPLCAHHGQGSAAGPAPLQGAVGGSARARASAHPARRPQPPPRAAASQAPTRENHEGVTRTLRPGPAARTQPDSEPRGTFRRGHRPAPCSGRGSGPSGGSPETRVRREGRPDPTRPSAAAGPERTARGRARTPPGPHQTQGSAPGTGRWPGHPPADAAGKLGGRPGGTRSRCLPRRRALLCLLPAGRRAPPGAQSARRRAHAGQGRGPGGNPRRVTGLAPPAGQGRGRARLPGAEPHGLPEAKGRGCPSQGDPQHTAGREQPMGRRLRAGRRQ